MSYYDYFFTEPEASRLAKLRIEARKKRRVTYDCLSAIVDGERVKCNIGRSIGHAADGSMNLVSVLSGRSSSVCQDCKGYCADKVTAKIMGKMSGQLVYD
jgi:hypothetical protein